MKVSLAANRIIRYLFLITVALAILSVTSRIVQQYGCEGASEYLSALDMEVEPSIPTHFASFELLLCAGFLAVLAIHKRSVKDRYAPAWTGLSVIFLYLSVDEVAMLHEKVGSLFKHATANSFHFVHWVIPFGVLLIIFGAVYLRFLFALPAKTRNLFIISGVVYVGAALVLETVDSLIWQVYGAKTHLHFVLSSLEEFLEMFGIALFAKAIIEYMIQYSGQFEVIVRGQTESTPSVSPSRVAAGSGTEPVSS